jgi:hypothetical protein
MPQKEHRVRPISRRRFPVLLYDTSTTPGDTTMRNLTTMLFSCLIGLFVSATATAVPFTETYGLYELSLSTQIAGWSNSTNWSFFGSNPCTFYGITCNQDGTHVTGIELAGNQLSGTLPDDFAARFPKLRTLALSSNQLNGDMPSLSGLAELEYLDLADNALTGQISQWTGLNKLVEIYISNNAFDGALPSLQGLPAVQFFYADRNQFSGSVSQFPSNSPIVQFVVAKNALIGVLPSLTGLSGLTQFGINDNQLSGLTDFGNSPQLTAFRAARNALSGSVPPLSGLTGLKDIDVSENSLSGSLPPLSSLTSLKTLNVYSNSLTGEIPALSALQNATSLNFSSNGFTGSMPLIAGLSKLNFLNISNNFLSGKIPTPSSTLVATGSAKLCPNDFDISPGPDDVAWNAIVSMTPWWGPAGAGCDLIFKEDFEL